MNIDIRHNFEASVRYMGGAGYELAFKLTTTSSGVVHMTHWEWALMLMHGAQFAENPQEGWSFKALENAGVFDFSFTTTTNTHHRCVTRRMLEDAAKASRVDGKAHRLYQSRAVATSR